MGNVRAMTRALSIMAALALTPTACATPTGGTDDGSIQGSVTDNMGAQVPNAGITLSGAGQAVRSTQSGADGTYSFASVPPGTYTLAVTAPTGFTTPAPSTASITVATGAQASASAFVLNRMPPVAGSIRGIVTDNIYTAVAHATVELSGNGQPARTVVTGCDGVYNFSGLAHGTYSLRVTPPAGFTSGSSSTVSQVISSGAQVTPPALRVTRPAGESAFANALRGHLATVTASNAFSGAVMITRNGEKVFEGACGFADREQGIPNTLDTKFRVGSMNKMLTAVAVLQLVQAGKVQLQAPFGTYISNYPNAEMASKVTIHHLLTHTGGTGDIFGAQYNANRLSLVDPDDYLELYGARALQFEPGAQFAYSNYGFMLLGAVVERVSGMRYDDYIAAHVLAPAGMTATGAAPETAVVPNRSVGYTMSGGNLVSNAGLLPYRGTPAGGGYSTAGDLERFATALLEHKLLDAAHTALLLDGKVSLGPNDVVQYAYGFFNRLQVGRRLVGHGGGFPGMNGELTFELAGGYKIVVLSNFDPPAATQLEFFVLTNLPNN